MRFIVAATLFALAAADLAAGNRYFRAGDYERAVTEYRRALEQGGASAELHYNLGTALLRLGRHEEAREHLELAARAEPAVVRQHAHYNAGNTHLEPAFRAPPSEQRIAELRSAITAYKQALRLDPNDQEAKWNLELAQRLLQQEAGGGGGDDADPTAGGGGGGADQDAPADPDPQPSPTGEGGAAPEASPTPAEQVLQAAELRERELQQEKLRREQVPRPNVRDW